MAKVTPPEFQPHLGPNLGSSLKRKSCEPFRATTFKLLSSRGPVLYRAGNVNGCDTGIEVASGLDDFWSAAHQLHHLLAKYGWIRWLRLGHHGLFFSVFCGYSYFCDSHSSWKRGSNENMNCLVRQYLLQGH